MKEKFQFVDKFPPKCNLAWSNWIPWQVSARYWVLISYFQPNIICLCLQNRICLQKFQIDKASARALPHGRLWTGSRLYSMYYHHQRSPAWRRDFLLFFLLFYFLIFALTCTVHWMHHGPRLGGACLSTPLFCKKRKGFKVKTKKSRFFYFWSSLIPQSALVCKIRYSRHSWLDSVRSNCPFIPWCYWAYPAS